MQQIFQAILQIKPQTWKRTEGGRHMPKTQRAYYYALYADIASAGMVPVANNALLSLEVTFYNSDARWRDLDNLIKCLLDCGQPSNWINPKKDVGYRDFWDDKQFSKIKAERVMSAYQDQIVLKIWEL